MKKALCLLAAAVSLPAGLFAQTTITGWTEGPIPFPGFVQIDAFIETPGIYFQTGGLSSFSVTTNPYSAGTPDPLWINTDVNAQFSFAVGDAISSRNLLYFDVNLTSSNTTPVTLDFYVLDARSTAQYAESWTYNGAGNQNNGNNYSQNPTPNLADENTSTPELSSILLIGSGMAAMGFPAHRNKKGLYLS